MAAWPTVRVGELAEQIRGVTFAKSDAVSAPGDGLFPVMTATNITENGLNTDSVLHIPKTKASNKQVLKKNDVIITASSGSLSVVGRAVLVRDDLNATFGAFCKVLRSNDLVDPNYFAHFFRTPQYRSKVAQLAAGANINNLRNEDLDNLEIPLPGLPEQRRIASTLDEAARLRSMSASGSHEAENLGAAFFRSLFENPARLDGGEVLPLGTVSEVVSGITKGRRTSDPTREVPYLTVANVQDRRLRLGLVKTIEATEREIARYRLRHGDILLTEGGDPDKLGRGAMWNGELDEVIHQNHVFRVRVRDQRLRPEYVSWLMSSARGRKYFASAAKQTTGIASINSTQLKAFPVPIPSTALQNEFAERLDESARIVARQVDQLAKLDELFASLQHRAFLGEL